MSSDSKSNNGAPSTVRAMEPILDEGLIFALPGDVGEVVGAGDLQEDGARWVMVRFPAAPRATTCILGEEVQPMFAVVTASHRPPAQLAPRTARRWPRRAATVAAAVLAGAVWCASGGWRAPDQVAELPRTPGDLVVVDIARTLGGSLFAGNLPSTFPRNWKRRPCDRGEREVRGACFLELRQTPPCVSGYEHDGRCLVPVAATEAPPSAIHR